MGMGRNQPKLALMLSVTPPQRSRGKLPPLDLSKSQGQEEAGEESKEQPVRHQTLNQRRTKTSKECVTPNVDKEV
jgi:hypothetical protein